MSVPRRQQRVALCLTVGLGAALAALAGRLIYIHATSGPALEERATRRHYSYRPLTAMRGYILDAQRRILAGSVEVQSVFADPAVMEDLGEAARDAAPVLGMKRDALYRLLTPEEPTSFIWLARRPPPTLAEDVRKLKIYGLGLAPEGQRRYPHGSLAAHVIGCVGIDEQGVEGLERLYNERLAGRPGVIYALADRSRRPMWTARDQLTLPRDGQHLVLTIDAAIQAVTEAALAEAVQAFRAEAASAIIMDPRTGAILAMANVPTFDPARFQDVPAKVRRNRALSDPSPPGSTAKPFIAAMALDRGKVRLGETFHCENGYWAEHRLRDAGHRYGPLTFEMVVAKSSNIGMAKIGVRLGNQALHETLSGFGFGRQTGVGLPLEDAGLVRPVSAWTRYSTTRVSFGQEFLATPLQLVTAFAALANDGRLMRPRILRGVLNSRGEVVENMEVPEVVAQVVRPETARTMVRDVLVRVVEEGTGKVCRIPGYRVFGKTGTAQGVDPATRAISHDYYFANFLAGAPADDPRVVVLVSVKHPDKALGYYGGTVAGPSARRILEETLAYLGVEPSAPEARPARPRVPTVLAESDGGL